MYFFSKTSHLEIVAPVVIGKHAAQDDTHAGGPTTDFHHGMPIIIHGDAISWSRYQF